MRSIMHLVAAVALACGCGSSASSGDGGDGADLAGGVGGNDGGAAIDAGASVLQLHKHANRDGVYVEPTLTSAAVATVHIDATFDGSYAQAGAKGPVYAQPLFVDNGGAGDELIVVTESNDVLAFDAAGKVKWHTGPSTLGQAAPNSAFGCGNIDPSGITGTPAVDLGTRAMFLQTDVLEGGKPHHKIHSLSIDDGTERPGWPIDVDLIIPGFADANQGERGALLVLGDRVFVPFGGRAGDCLPYRGYVVSLPLSSPTAANAAVFATKAEDAQGGGAAGGIWAPTGVSSDGASIFFDTGNAQGTFPMMWTDSYTEGVFRLPPSLAFDATDTTRWFAPMDWRTLDQNDIDISGSGVLIVDAPGVTPSPLAAVLGKDSKLYLLDAANLGGMTPSGLFATAVAASEIINAPVSYTTTKGTYVAFKAACPGGGAPTVNAVPIVAGPKTGTAWCAGVQGGGSPMVTTTGGGADTVVWFVSTEGENIAPDYKLYGFDGDTGKKLVSTAAMTPSQRFISPIAAKGRIFVAADDKLFAFTP